MTDPDFIIPNSGPAGRVGFDDPWIINRIEEGFKHSDFFKKKNMKNVFEKLWWPFLQNNEKELDEWRKNQGSRPNWKQAWWPFQATIFRYLVLLLMSIASISLLIALILGYARIF